jgi:hypothetical protein
MALFHIRNLKECSHLISNWNKKERSSKRKLKKRFKGMEEK